MSLAKSYHSVMKEGNVLFNDALNTYYLVICKPTQHNELQCQNYEILDLSYSPLKYNHFGP